MTPFRKKLISNPSLNPFNTKFDIKKFTESFFDISINWSEEKIGKHELHFAATILNRFYIELYDFLKDQIVNIGLDSSQILNSSIAAINRNFLLVEEKFFDSSKGEFKSIIDLYKDQVESVDSSIGKINTIGAIESEIDSLNILSSYLTYFEGNKSIKKISFQKTEQVDMIKSILMSVSFLYLLKTCYEECIWNNGHIKVTNKSILIDFRNREELILRKVGVIRLMNNIQSTIIISKELFDSPENNIVNVFLSEFNSYTKTKRIKKIFTEDGLVKYKLAKGIDKNHQNAELQNISSLITYYSFLKHEKLTTLENLTIYQLIQLFSTIQLLFYYTLYENKPLNDSVYKIQDFQKFPLKIKFDELISYLLSITTFSRKQIICFIKLLTNKKNKRVNFWNHPFYLNKNKELVFPFLTIIRPNLLYLVDFWLTEGDFDLDKRGKYFESYIKEDIKKALSIRKYQFIIPSKNKFRINKINEEIDLIINLKHIVIIAELKCIKYPLEIRSEHNAQKRLKDGSKQLNRKLNFIVKNSDKLLKDIGSIKGKKIIPLLVTNYPLYTGFKFNQVTVVDYNLLKSYISTGFNTNNELITNKGKVVSNKVRYRHDFYKNEDEFCFKFEAFINNPPIINEIKKNIEVKSLKITPESSYYQVFINSADYKKK